MMARRWAASCLLAGALGSGAARAAEPAPRPLPDYDGRGGTPETPAQKALWLPRVLLSPLYFVSEFVIRKPLGAGIAAAERADLPRVLYDFFAFGPDHKAGIVPIAFLDFGFEPSVGLYGFWDDAGFKGHDLRLHGSTWGAHWLSATATERFRFSERFALTLTSTATRRPDYAFYGIGPDTRNADLMRYSSDSVDAHAETSLSFADSSLLETAVGYRGASYGHSNFDGDDRSVDEALRGREPPGFQNGFRAPFARARLVLDSRPKSGSETGVRVEASAEQGADLKNAPTSGWLRYGGTVGGFVDLLQSGRIVSLSLSAFLADPLGPRPIPFTELVTLGGPTFMPGFRPGRLYDRSGAVATLRYSWPIWVWLDGSLQVATGNVFGARFDGFRAERGRLSTAIGIESRGSRDSVFQALVGFGSETFESGARLDSLRIVVGPEVAFELRLPAFALAVVLAGCASPARFPLQAPLTKDDDQKPFAKAPEEYYSPFAWDGANYMVFHPIARFFAVDPAGTTTNVNALDEVPNSSWFENRGGSRPLSADEVFHGPCGDQVLDPSAPDGTWTIDRGKDNGANPGFRVNIKGLGKFMLKTDPETEPDRATGATSIASRIYHAAGYYAPCDSVVYFRPALLKLKPGLTITNNEGVTKPFDQARLDSILKQASHRNGLVRMVASAWLSGKPLGPYRYEGTRDDDPNDVIPHEDRRELRGARLIAAWLNHFDTREQNTMDVFLPLDKDNKDSPGFVRHYIIDMGDCFGSLWAADGISRRLGNSYVFDAGHIAEDFVTLGTKVRPWEAAQRNGGIFGYFSARDFDPESWRGEYPNPAFMRMTEGDGAWMARILARFTDELVSAAVKVGQYDPVSEKYLAETLIARRRAILSRYLNKLSPIANVTADARGVCGVDLARQTGTVPNEALTFRAYLYRGTRKGPAPKPRFRNVSGPQVCLDIAHADFPASLPLNSEQRYVIADITNGYAPGPLRVHLYDLGEAGGYRLVGVERPPSLTRPN